METLQDLFAHNDWAAGNVLAAAGALANEQLDRPFEMGCGTIRATLHHLWAAEKIWLERWQRVADPRFVQPEAGIPVAELRERCAAIAAERDAFLATLKPGQADSPLTYRNLRGDTFTEVLSDLMLHVCNHGVHHRAQAMVMIRVSGGAPVSPGQDYLYMRVERPTVAQRPEAVAALEPLGLRVGASLACPVQHQPARLRRYLAYGDWASARVLHAAAELGESAADQSFDIGLRTLRRTLLHILDAETWWVGNWSGDARPFSKLPESTTLTELQSRYRESAAARDAVLQRIGSPADCAREVHAEVRWRIWLRFRLGESVVQLCTHGTHHRAQALNLIRRLSGKPPGLDFVTWTRSV